MDRWSNGAQALTWRKYRTDCQTRPIYLPRKLHFQHLSQNPAGFYSPLSFFCWFGLSVGQEQPDQHRKGLQQNIWCPAERPTGIMGGGPQRKTGSPPNVTTSCPPSLQHRTEEPTGSRSFLLSTIRGCKCANTLPHQWTDFALVYCLSVNVYMVLLNSVNWVAPWD